MALISLKKPKKEIEAEKKDNQTSFHEEVDVFPHGTRINLHDEVLDKFPGLIGSSTDDIVTGTFEAKVTEVSKREVAQGKDHQNVELQITALEIEKEPDKEFEEGFDNKAATLRKAYYQLSDRDSESGYRRAITDRIAELQQVGEQRHQHSETEVVDLRPNFFGLGLNLNEAWRRIRSWWGKK